MLDDLHRAIYHHEEGAIAIALGKEGLTGVHWPALAPGPEGRHVAWAENGKGDVEFGCHAGR